MVLGIPQTHMKKGCNNGPQDQPINPSNNRDLSTKTNTLCAESSCVECHSKRREFENQKKVEEERRKEGSKGNPNGGGCNPGRCTGKGNPIRGQRSSVSLQVAEDSQTMDPAKNMRLNNTVRSVLHPFPQQVLAALKRAKMPKKGS